MAEEALQVRQTNASSNVKIWRRKRANSLKRDSTTTNSNDMHSMPGNRVEQRALYDRVKVVSKMPHCLASNDFLSEGLLHHAEFPLLSFG